MLLAVVIAILIAALVLRLIDANPRLTPQA